VFAKMRRKRHSATLKHELGQSVDHFKRAASIAAQETSATVGPKLKTAVQPAVTQAKGAASTGWESAVATLAPLVAAATENMRQAGKASATMSKRQAKAGKKGARKLEKRANKMLGREPAKHRAARMFGLAVAGAAIGAGAAYVMRKRRAAQWEEYDPAAPITPKAPVEEPTARLEGADDAAFEPSGQDALAASVGDTADQTASAQHSPKVARMASGHNENV
jgi:hypothetical protein